MKLTNISLAILVAIGLVACGGSDDKNNQTTDNNNAGNHNTGNNNPPPPPPKGDSALDPKRAAPDLTVADDLKGIVAANKRIFIDRGFSDTALGYETDGTTYDEDMGTDPANVKLTSTYNFSSQNDLITSSIATADDPKSTEPAATTYTKSSAGAIYVGDWNALTTGTANAFVKAGGKYIRVQAVVPAANGEAYTPKTQFEFTANAKAVLGGAPIPGVNATDKFSQKKVVFIANAADAGANSDIIDLGTPTTDTYNVKKGQVLLQSVSVFGKEYPADSIGKNLEFGSLNPMKEIQTAKVTGSYLISNNKDSAPNTDDKNLTKSIDLGVVKAYNLPYSTALVTTNIDKDNPAEKNIFNLTEGPFKVFGFKTVSLPQNGRTFYTGKSFNAKNTGDVTLYADFFEDRAGIEGAIENRKDHNGNELATLTLDRISLVESGQNYKTGGSGNVEGDQSYATHWTVQLYGPEAEEAAGTLRVGSATGTIKEVFNTQRKELTNKSNDDTTK